VKAATHPAPTPKQRRRRSEETRGGFKLAVAKIVQWAKRQTTRPDKPPGEPVWHEMQWREFWGEHWRGAEDTSAAECGPDCERPDASHDRPDFSPGL
jgi:hypothetical protein